jgi:hypothetical protein
MPPAKLARQGGAVRLTLSAKVANDLGDSGRAADSAGLAGSAARPDPRAVA